MQFPAQIHQDKLEDFKQKVEEWHEYFRDNISRFHFFRNYVFQSSLSDSVRNTLEELGKPDLEFNMLEGAIISPLRGEFSQQEPSISVRAADGIPIQLVTPQLVDTIKVVEAHLRAICFDAKNDNTAYDTFNDTISGGYAVQEVYAAYLGDKTFEQGLFVRHHPDPTMCVFDPLASESHKGDGRYCATIYPITQEEFEKRYGKELAQKIKFYGSLGSFSWSFKNERDAVILICDFYLKERKKIKLLRLSNGYTVTQDEYDELAEKWAQEELILPLPSIVQTRSSYETKIVRYRFCENKVLDRAETNYTQLPLVFFDGNSQMLKNGEQSKQMTRPIVYHAKGIQDLKNFAGQTFAAEIENLVQNKWVVAVEAVPDGQDHNYTNIQQLSVLLYHHFYKQNPDVPLPAPQPVQRTPIPPEVAQAFTMSDEMTKAILGDMDMSKGLARGEVSGVTMARAMMKGNLSSRPYIVGYLKGLNQVAQIIVDLIPKYYKTPRTLPVLLPNGRREYLTINNGQGAANQIAVSQGEMMARQGLGMRSREPITLNYDTNALQVKVEAGVNFELQKEMSLQTLEHLSSSMPGFANFMQQEGLEVVLDNIDIRGIEALKAKVPEYQAQIQQTQQAAQQQQMMEMQTAQGAQAMAREEQQLNLLLKQKELNAPAKETVDMYRAQTDAQYKSADVAIQERVAEDNFLEILAKIQNEKVNNELKDDRIEAETARTAVDSAIAASKHLTEE